jgi:ribosomal-protein-alanine N-acetyltransferase
MLDELAGEVESFSLEVRAGNVAAISLYEGMGFRMAGRRPDFYEKPVEDALVFVKNFH